MGLKSLPCANHRNITVSNALLKSSTAVTYARVREQLTLLMSQNLCPTITSPGDCTRYQQSGLRSTCVTLPAGAEPVTSWSIDCNWGITTSGPRISCRLQEESREDFGIDCASTSDLGTRAAGQSRGAAAVCDEAQRINSDPAETSNTKSARSAIHAVRELSHVYFMEADPQYS